VGAGERRRVGIGGVHEPSAFSLEALEAVVAEDVVEARQVVGGELVDRDDDDEFRRRRERGGGEKEKKNEQTLQHRRSLNDEGHLAVALIGVKLSKRFRRRRGVRVCPASASGCSRWRAGCS